MNFSRSLLKSCVYGWRPVEEKNNAFRYGSGSLMSLEAGKPVDTFTKMPLSLPQKYLSLLNSLNRKPNTHQKHSPKILINTENISTYEEINCLSLFLLSHLKIYAKRM